jgi:hypothetical protein
MATQLTENQLLLNKLNSYTNSKDENVRKLNELYENHYKTIKNAQLLHDIKSVCRTIITTLNNLKDYSKTNIQELQKKAGLGSNGFLSSKLQKDIFKLQNDIFDNISEIIKITNKLNGNTRTENDNSTFSVNVLNKFKREYNTLKPAEKMPMHEIEAKIEEENIRYVEEESPEAKKKAVKKAEKDAEIAKKEAEKKDKEAEKEREKTAKKTKEAEKKTKEAEKEKEKTEAKLKKEEEEKRLHIIALSRREKEVLQRQKELAQIKAEKETEIGLREIKLKLNREDLHTKTVNLLLKKAETNPAILNKLTKKIGRRSQNRTKRASINSRNSNENNSHNALYRKNIAVYKKKIYDIIKSKDFIKHLSDLNNKRLEYKSKLSQENSATLGNSFDYINKLDNPNDVDCKKLDTLYMIIIKEYERQTEESKGFKKLRQALISSSTFFVMKKLQLIDEYCKLIKENEDLINGKSQSHRSSFSSANKVSIASSIASSNSNQDQPPESTLERICRLITKEEPPQP